MISYQKICLLYIRIRNTVFRKSKHLGIGTRGFNDAEQNAAGQKENRSKAANRNCEPCLRYPFEFVLPAVDSRDSLSDVSTQIK